MRTEIAFWDTSAIIPLCVFQETTTEARKVRRGFVTSVVWWGTTVEIRSTLARLVGAGELSSKDFAFALKKWLSFKGHGREIKPSENLLDVAAELPEKYGLRALDSFQLAAALEWCGERPRNRPFITADRRLAEAASDAGFDVITLT